MEKQAKTGVSPIIKAVIAPLILLAAALLLFGCGKKADIAFSLDSLSVYVGESRDLFPYALFTPSTAERKEFRLESDSDIIEIDGTRIKATAPGSAVIRAIAPGGETELAVTAAYRPITVIKLEMTGDAVQNGQNGDISPVKFTAALEKYTDPDERIVWTVNGEEKTTGASYTLEPSYGEYDVVCSAGDISEERVVRVYRETAARGEAVGPAEQTHDFSPVRLAAIENIHPDNPRSVIEWYVNGLKAADGYVYDFAPRSAGVYEIGLYVNGVRRDFGAEHCYTVTATGDRAPTPSVVFDDEDGVVVVWSDGAQARSVTVTSPSGLRATYERSDARYAERFFGGRFDATDIIELFSGTPGEYKVSVVGDSRGEAASFMQLDNGLSSYVNDKVLIYNSYLSDEADIERWVHELFMCGKPGATAYVAADFDSSEEVIAVAARAAEFYGMTEASFNFSDRLLSATLGLYYNKPTEQGEGGDSAQYTEIPHIEYSADSLRGASYTLAIERIKNKVAVTTTEQLYYVAEHGYKPMPLSSSTADMVYTRAKTLLMSIIGKDFTDVQKVHAVYDWLQWWTHNVHDGGNTAANYLEGVFGGSGYSASGAVTSAGMAKALSLMCNIEGIPCVTTVENINGENYFKNMTKLGNMWYNIDAFGGKCVVDGNEIMSHKGLLRSDGAADVFGAFDDGNNYYLEKLVYKGEYTDRYITAADSDDDIKNAVYAAFDAQTFDTLSMPGIGRTGYILSSYGAAELMFDPGITPAERARMTAVAKAAAAAYKRDAFRTRLVIDKASGDLLFLRALMTE